MALFLIVSWALLPGIHRFLIYLLNRFYEYQEILDQDFIYKAIGDMRQIEDRKDFFTLMLKSWSTMVIVFLSVIIYIQTGGTLNGLWDHLKGLAGK
jgi:hypothetical protein